MKAKYLVRLSKVMKKSHYLWRKRNNRLSWSDCLRKAWRIVKLNLSRRSDKLVTDLKDVNNIYLFKNTHKDIEFLWVSKFLKMLIGSPDKLVTVMDRRAEYSTRMSVNNPAQYYIMFNN